MGTCAAKPPQRPAFEFGSLEHLLAAAPASGPGVAVACIRVIDGDTALFHALNTALSVRVRFAGINTPELKSRNPKLRAVAQDAKAFAASKLVDARNVHISPLGRGKFGRIVAAVWVGAELLNCSIFERFPDHTIVLNARGERNRAQTSEAIRLVCAPRPPCEA